MGPADHAVTVSSIGNRLLSAEDFRRLSDVSSQFESNPALRKTKNPPNPSQPSLGEDNLC